MHPHYTYCALVSMQADTVHGCTSVRYNARMLKGSSVASVIGAYIVSPAVLWAAFAVMVIVSSLLSAVLIYHWRQYGMGKRIFNQVELLYLSGVGVLIVCAFIALTLYSL